jgi:hypothetical protein
LLQQNYAGCRDKLSRFWKRRKVVVMSRGIEVVRPCVRLRNTSFATFRGGCVEWI